MTWSAHVSGEKMAVDAHLCRWIRLEEVPSAIVTTWWRKVLIGRVKYLPSTIDSGRVWGKYPRVGVRSLEASDGARVKNGGGRRRQHGCCSFIKIWYLERVHLTCVSKAVGMPNGWWFCTQIYHKSACGIINPLCYIGIDHLPDACGSTGRTCGSIFVCPTTMEAQGNNTKVDVDCMI